MRITLCRGTKWWHKTTKSKTSSPDVFFIGIPCVDKAAILDCRYPLDTVRYTPRGKNYWAISSSATLFLSSTTHSLFLFLFAFRFISNGLLSSDSKYLSSLAAIRIVCFKADLVDATQKLVYLYAVWRTVTNTQGRFESRNDKWSSIRITAERTWMNE